MEQEHPKILTGKGVVWKSGFPRTKALISPKRGNIATRLLLSRLPIGAYRGL